MNTTGRRNVNILILIGTRDMEVSFGVPLSARDVCLRKRNA